MSDQVLRLRATAETSSAQKGLADLKKSFGKTAAEGSKSVKELSGSLSALKLGFQDLTRGAADTGASLLGVGIGVLSLTGAIGGLVAATKSLSGSAQQLNNFQKATGISAQTAQQFGIALRQMGLSADEAQPAMEKLHKMADDFRKGLDHTHFRGIGSFASDITAAHGDAAKELDALWRAGQGIKDPTARRSFFEEYTGDANLASANLKDFRTHMAAAAKSPALISQKQIDDGVAFNRTLERMSEALDGLRNAAGDDMAKALTGPIKDLKDVLDKDGPEIEKDIKGIADTIGELTGDLKTAFEYGSKFADVLNQVNGGANSAGKWVHDHVVNPIGTWFNGGGNTKSPWAAVQGAAAERLNAALVAATFPQSAYTEKPKTAYGSFGRDRTAHGDALSDQGAKFGEQAGKAIAKPLGPADQFGTGAAKAFWKFLSDSVASLASADTLAGQNLTNATAAAGGGRMLAGHSQGGPLEATGASAGVRGWWTAERQKHAYDVLTKEGGLSPAGAKGLISRWVNVKSSGGPTSANNIGGGHYGLAQWGRSRLAGLGRNPDFDAQLQHVIGELNGKESIAAKRLRTALTDAEGATGASMYERAEGYDASTGRDNYTNRTLGGMRGMDKVLSGGASTNATAAALTAGTHGDTLARAIRTAASTAQPQHRHTVTPMHKHGSHLEVTVHAPAGSKVDVKDRNDFFNKHTFRRHRLTTDQQLRS